MDCKISTEALLKHSLRYSSRPQDTEYASSVRIHFKDVKYLHNAPLNALYISDYLLKYS